METFAFLLLGLGIGTFGTLVGVGGGFLLVPIFIMVLHWSPAHAVGTSLAIVFLNALSGSIAYIRQQKVYYHAAIRFSIATFPGALTGSYLVQYFSGAGFRLTFGILLVLLAFLMYFRPRSKSDSIAFDKNTFSYNQPLGITISILIGFLSSILGVGGGIIHVPAMVYLLSFPPHIATATSQFILGISAFVGVLSHLWLNNVLIVPALLIGSGAVAGAQIGARLALRTKSRSILVLLAVTLFLIGLHMSITAYHSF